MRFVGRVGRRLVVREARGRSLSGVLDGVSGRPGPARQALDLTRDRAQEGPAVQRWLGKWSLRLPTEAESVSVGRRWLRDGLSREFGAGHPVIGNAVQALSEILTNAILYGSGLHVRVTCSLDGEWAEVAVHNGGRPGGVRPQRQDPAPDAECGRGLELVEAFSDEWGITVLEQGEIKVWFRVRFA